MHKKDLFSIPKYNLTSTNNKFHEDKKNLEVGVMTLKKFVLLELCLIKELRNNNRKLNLCPPQKQVETQPKLF